MQRSDFFLRAVHNLKTAVPVLRETLFEHIEAQVRQNSVFRAAFASCFDALANHVREEYKRSDQFGVFEPLANLEPDFTSEQFTAFLVQHFLLDPLLRSMFPDVLARNPIARQVEGIMQVFENRAWLRLSVDGYFALIERELSVASTSEDRQQVFNTVVRHFLSGFDPRRAEELGIIYTPPEVVNFMCSSCEEQLEQAYGRSLSSTNVPILDPCTGNGAFLVNIIGRIEPTSLPYKYANELFGVEILFLSYYLATLNIEQAFFERCGYYHSFPGMRYADALLA